MIHPATKQRTLHISRLHTESKLTVCAAEIFCQGFLQTWPEQHSTQLGCGAYRKQRGFWVKTAHRDWEHWS